MVFRDHRVRSGAPSGLGLATSLVSTEPRRMLPVQPRTMVEQAAEAIVAAAARGSFLPGDRLVEAEIARDLGISRVPVREALRLLESQGIVVSTPYKGMRLMQVSNDGVAALMRVRLALENLAVLEAMRRPVTVQIPHLDAPFGRPARFTALAIAADDYAAAAGSGDPALIVAAEEHFHAGLCRASGNAPLLALWQSLSRQLMVIWGLGQQGGNVSRSVREHGGLLDAMERGHERAATAALAAHIDWHRDYDFEAVVVERRRQGTP